jgi:dTDP-4-dehydrorhamnose reductase
VDNQPQGKTSNPEDMVKLAEKQLGRPVDKADVAQVAAILLKRLDSEELSFIYQQMTKEGKPSSAEIKKAKQILQNKLTPEELELVQEVALKYGKKINF